MSRVPRVPSDVIVYAFSFLKPGTRFAMDKRKIIKIFYDISQEKVFAELFKDFILDTSRNPSIFCETVNCAIDHLTKSDLLIRIGLENFEVTKALTQKDATEIFGKDEIPLLKDIALMFAKRIKAYKPY